jgi:hypothetical protein
MQIGKSKRSEHRPLLHAHPPHRREHVERSDRFLPYPGAMRVASPDSPYSQITSERMEARVVSETVDATNISSQWYSPARM